MAKAQLPDLPGPTPWLQDPAHRRWLLRHAYDQLDFFRHSLNATGGFDALDHQGQPLPNRPQELHTTTRMIHSFALGKIADAPNCDRIIDAGMHYLWQHHRDQHYGGYLWAIGAQGGDLKLAYGHVFVLLAASSAKMLGHPDADRLLTDITDILERHFWDESRGLFTDEFTRDWQSFSTYRGMNANMHGVEALLAAYEATGSAHYLDRAGRILDFFTCNMAPRHHWRIPEHYNANWQVDPDYSGNPMFRPAGTTPGHALEFARLALQHWELAGRPESDVITRAQNLVDQAFKDGWLPTGGFAYTLDTQGKIAIPDRYWWPVTEAIGALAALIKCSDNPENERRYREAWQMANHAFIDHEHGGWFPEIDAKGRPCQTQFIGKPDIYHALQAALLPLTPGLARAFETPAADFLFP